MIASGKGWLNTTAHGSPQPFEGADACGERISAARRKGATGQIL
jgi:hypothetical protein